MNALQEDVFDAIGILRQTPNLPSPQVVTLAGHAERKAVKVRDSLIVNLRQQPAGPDAAEMRRSLRQVNLALTCLSRLVYPAALQREHIDEAIQELDKIFGTLTPGQAGRVVEQITGIEGGLSERRDPGQGI